MPVANVLVIVIITAAAAPNPEQVKHEILYGEVHHKRDVSFQQFTSASRSLIH